MKVALLKLHDFKDGTVVEFITVILVLYMTARKGKHYRNQRSSLEISASLQ